MKTIKLLFCIYFILIFYKNGDSFSIAVFFLYKQYSASIIMNLYTLSLLGTIYFSATINAATLSVHCPYGCPENPVGNDLIFNHIYALSNNPNTKFADWVSYEVNPINYGTSPGRNWKSEPLLHKDKTLEEMDYRGVYKSNLKADKGHQAPLASFAGSRYWYEVDYLSNITPQNKNLNRGPWKALEKAIRNAATVEHPLYVITGPTFDMSMPKMPEANEPHQVPSGYFKIVYDKSGGVAFWMGQGSTKQDDYCSKQVSFDEIANRVNFKLQNFKEQPRALKWIGCRN